MPHSYRTSARHSIIPTWKSFRWSSKGGTSHRSASVRSSSTMARSHRPSSKDSGEKRGCSASPNYASFAALLEWASQYYGLPIELAEVCCQWADDKALTKDECKDLIWLTSERISKAQGAPEGNPEGEMSSTITPSDRHKAHSDLEHSRLMLRKGCVGASGSRTSQRPVWIDDPRRAMRPASTTSPSVATKRPQAL